MSAEIVIVTEAAEIVVKQPVPDVAIGALASVVVEGVGLSADVPQLILEAVDNSTLPVDAAQWTTNDW